MKHLSALPAFCASLLIFLPAHAADIDWKKVDAALGKTATVSGEVHRYGLPRSDLHVTLMASPSSRRSRWAAGWRLRRCMDRPW